jgi:hypothetical protein
LSSATLLYHMRRLGIRVVVTRHIQAP